MPVCDTCGLAYLESESHDCTAKKRGSVSEKSLPLAIGLNVVLPGVGYIYMGRVVLGLGALLLVALVFVSAGLLLPVVWLGMNVIMAIDMVIWPTRIKP